MLKPWAIQTDHEDLFIQRYDQMLKWSRRLVDDRHAAADLVHDVFIQFTLTRPDLGSIQNLDGYLYTMLRNRHLSAVRRSARNPLERLSAVDYDSVEIGLRATDPRRQLQVQEELRAICAYGCRRKDTSKAGGVLLLRFFHAYYPVEIARILNSTRAAVDIWLRIARNEAKSYLDNPECPGFIQARAADERDAASFSPVDFAGNLRREVFRTRVGDCLSVGGLKRLYDAGKQPLELTVVSHVASCLVCLTAVSNLLGLAPPSERHPTDSLGPDRRGGGTGSASQRESAAIGRRRSRDVFEHLPNKLAVSANGFFVGSQNVSSELSELTLSIKLDEPVGFIEVHSEQEVLLLAMMVEPPPSGPVEQSAAARFSEDRRIEAEIDFSEAWPRLSVVYHDPSYEASAEAVPKSLADPDGFESAHGSNATIQVSEKGERSAQPVWDTITGTLRAIFSLSFWLRPAVVTSALAVIISAAVFLFKLWTPSVSASELLAQATRSEGALNATAGVVLHRTIALEGRSLVSDAPASHYKIETWRSAEPVGGVTRAMRLYDDNYKLCAGAWTLADGSQSQFGANQLAVGNPAALRLAGSHAWQLEPSAETFAALIGNAGPGSVEQHSDSYVVSFVGQSAAEPRLVRASLRLHRPDLRAIEQTIVIDTGQDRIEYRFAEVQFEQRPSVSVPREVFAPERGPKAEQRYNVTPPGAAALPQFSKQAAAASPELELEVAYLLDKAGATMGEQVSVTRSKDGRLLVAGVLDTAKRRTEIVNALRSVATNPAVRIDLVTAAEALKRQRQGEATSGQRYEFNEGGASGAQAMVEAYLKTRGVDASQLGIEGRRLSDRIVSRSRGSLQHAWALKRLVEQLSAADVAALSAESRGKRVEIIRKHAAAIARETDRLRVELQAIFGSSQSASDEPRIASEGELMVAVRRLVDLASSSDSKVRAAFILSNGENGWGPGSGQELVHALNRVSRLAGRIESARVE